jgi:uncharacterized SAM-binding protein YcdF (DUF218 family)
MNKVFNWVCRIFGIFLIIIPILTVFVHFHVFSLYYPAFVGVFIFFLPEISELIKLIFPKKYPIIKKLVICIISLCIIWFIVVSVIMIRGFSTPLPPKGTPVVILGCGLAGTHIDIMLQSRADTAIDYLKHKDTTAKCIVSGGKGEDELLSEAQAIKNYLFQNGIPENRIIIEDKSTNTYENIRNTADIIKKDGITNLAVATDAYHEFRVSMLVKKQNLEFFALPSHTPPNLFLAYWIRESLAVTKVLVFGS